MSSITSTRNRRVVVIGLDGATLDLALPWIRAGHLPALKRLMERGGGGRLQSVLPVLSPSAWASFATGVNPGRHGIFDFVQRTPGSYRLRLITSRDVKVPPVWRLLSEAGKRVAVIDVPMTYPAEPVNGIMITGLGTPDRQVFTYPPELSEQLRARGYRVNKTVFYRPGGEAAFLKDVYDITQQVANTALSVLKQEPWDFFMVVFRDSDEMSHFFWKHMDASHPAHNPQVDGEYANALLDYYRYLDQLVGQLVEAAGPDANVIIMSDHGLGPLYKDVFLNEWLHQQGLLAVNAPTGPSRQQILARAGLTRSNVSRFLQKAGLAPFERSLRTALGDKKNLLPANNRAVFPDAIDWSRTQCYSHGYHGQVFLNVREREPLGVVGPGAPYQQLRAEIEEKLYALIDSEDGLPVVSKIVRQEQAFQGLYASWGADLVVVMRDFSYITRQGYEFTEQPGQIFSRPTTYESGSHRLDGLLFVAGPDFRSSGDLPVHSILDVTPTILHLLGVSIPDHIDGTILFHEMKPESRSTVDRYDYVNPEPVSSSTSNSTLSPEEEGELIERLKNLGYLD
jgi:predicted AlkP superfamily phosphohydrolase/phosphomutase